MPEILQYSFMQRAFLAGLIIAITTPLIGSFLVIRRLSLVSDTLSHIALSGVALGLILGISPLAATLTFTVLCALGIERLRSNKNLPGDAVLAMFLPGGLALSIVLTKLAGGFNSSLFSYLFGSIATVSQSDLYLILMLGILTIATIKVFYQKLLLSSLDEDIARASGIRLTLVNSLLMVLTATTVSLSLKVIGALLIGALMVIPVVSAMQIARSFRQTISLAILLAILEVTSGLILAYYLDLPAGGVIVLVSLGIFFVLNLFNQRRLAIG